MWATQHPQTARATPASCRSVHGLVPVQQKAGKVTAAPQPGHLRMLGVLMDRLDEGSSHALKQRLTTSNIGPPGPFHYVSPRQ
jgi:hypothetical protein